LYILNLELKGFWEVRDRDRVRVRDRVRFRDVVRDRVRFRDMVRDRVRFRDMVCLYIFNLQKRDLWEGVRERES
jgi:hypothetical protein